MSDTLKNDSPKRMKLADLGLLGGHLQLNPDDFIPSTAAEKEAFIPQYKSVSYWKDAWRRLRKNYIAMICLAIIIIIVLFAFLGPVFVPYTYEQQVRGSENLAPMKYSQQELDRIAAGEKVFIHVFGTDTLGRDSMVRLMYGCRVSMSIGLSAAFLTMLIGTIFGSIAGFSGGHVDMIMMRIIDLIYSLPDVLLVLLLGITFKPFLVEYTINHPETTLGRFFIAMGPSVVAIFFSFALLYWTVLARIVRGQVLQLKQQEFVTAARALGADNKRIIVKHILPNCIGPLVASTCLQIPTAIFLESFLSFLGVGVTAPMTSLGSLAADSLSGMYSFPYRLIIPAVFLSLLIFSFNIFGDGLRDALDPRLKK
jgi:oligopeptide transport system permease protein